MSPSDRLSHLMQKYLRSACTASELQELTWLLNDLGDEALDDQLQHLWAAQGELSAPNAVDWQRVRTELELQGKSESVEADLATQAVRLWTRLAAAAVVLVAIGLAAAYLYWGSFAVVDTESSQLVELHVPIQQTDTLWLPDGTRVTLNAGSTLRYAKAFDGDLREVHLEGEALFDVTPDSTRPFIVHSGQLRTRVLGTSFNVSAYAGQERMEVTVISGKVEVEEVSTGRKAELLPEERVTYAAVDDRFEKVQVKAPEQSTAWKVGRLAFDDTSLLEVAKQFYRKYGREMVLEGEGLQHCRLSMAFNQETPEDIIAIIAALSNAQYREEGNQIVIYGEGCN